MNRSIHVAVFTLLLLIASPLFAHPLPGETLTFGAGFFHPLSDLSHSLSLLIVGLWSDQRQGKFHAHDLLVIIAIVFVLLLNLYIHGFAVTGYSSWYLLGFGLASAVSLETGVLVSMEIDRRTAKIPQYYGYAKSD